MENGVECNGVGGRGGALAPPLPWPSVLMFNHQLYMLCFPYNLNETVIDMINRDRANGNGQIAIVC